MANSQLQADVTTNNTKVGFTDALAKSAAVVNSTAGSETDQAPSVSAIKTYTDAKVIDDASGTETTIAASVNAMKEYVKTRAVFGNNTSTNINLNNTGTFDTNKIHIMEESSTLTGDNTYFEVIDNTVIVKFSGYVIINANLHIIAGVGTTAARNAIQLRTVHQNTPKGPIASTGYIRDTNNHNESSLHISGYILEVAEDDVIYFGVQRESSNSQVTEMAINGSSTFSIKKLNH